MQWSLNQESHGFNSGSVNDGKKLEHVPGDKVFDLTLLDCSDYSFEGKSGETVEKIVIDIKGNVTYIGDDGNAFPEDKLCWSRQELEKLIRKETKKKNLKKI